MKIIKSDKAKKKYDYLCDLLVARSRDKFNEGIYTAREALAKPIADRLGIPESEPFLLSSYNGGAVTTITTKDCLWLYETSELEGAKEIASIHEKIATPFVVVVR